jgi:hypothetical protein
LSACGCAIVSVLMYKPYHHSIFLHTNSEKSGKCRLKPTQTATTSKQNVGNTDPSGQNWSNTVCRWQHVATCRRHFQLRTAQRRLDGKGRHDSSSTVMDGEGRRERSGNGNGQRNDDSRVMDSGARRRWTEQGQLNGNGRRVGNITTMDYKEGKSAMAMSTRSTMEATKASAASRH